MLGGGDVDEDIERGRESGGGVWQVGRVVGDEGDELGHGLDAGGEAERGRVRVGWSASAC